MTGDEDNVVTMKPRKGGEDAVDREAERNRLAQAMGIVETVRLALAENGETNIDGDSATSLQAALQVAFRILEGVYCRIEPSD